MHDAHLGCALFFLDMLAGYTLLSMTVMVTPCLWYVVGMNLVCPMSQFPQAPFALLANADRSGPEDFARKTTPHCCPSRCNGPLGLPEAKGDQG